MGEHQERECTSSPEFIFCFCCSNVFTLYCQRVITQSLASDWLAKNASLISGLISTHPLPQLLCPSFQCAEAEKEKE